MLAGAARCKPLMSLSSLPYNLPWVKRVAYCSYVMGWFFAIVLGGGTVPLIIALVYGPRSIVQSWRAGKRREAARRSGYLVVALPVLCGWVVLCLWLASWS